MYALLTDVFISNLGITLEADVQDLCLCRTVRTDGRRRIPNRSSLEVVYPLPSWAYSNASCRHPLGREGQSEAHPRNGECPQSPQRFYRVADSQ